MPYLSLEPTVKPPIPASRPELAAPLQQQEQTGSAQPVHAHSYGRLALYPPAAIRGTESAAARLPAQAWEESAPRILWETLRAPGAALDPELRGNMESRFDRDFSAVRIHDGHLAHQSAAALRASAFTLGQDIVFGAGRYEPGNPQSERLLAHELAHVVQSRTGQRDQRGSSVDLLEREAQEAASALPRSGSMPAIRGSAGPAAAPLRQPEEGGKGTYSNLDTNAEPDPQGVKMRVELIREGDVWYERRGREKFRASGSYDFAVINGRIIAVKGSNAVGAVNPKHTEAANGVKPEYLGKIRFGSSKALKGQLQSWSNASGHYAPIGFRRFAEAAGLPMDRFQPVRDGFPDKGPQLPVIRQKTTPRDDRGAKIPGGPPRLEELEADIAAAKKGGPALPRAATPEAAAPRPAPVTKAPAPATAQAVDKPPAVPARAADKPAAPTVAKPGAPAAAQPRAPVLATKTVAPAPTAAAAAPGKPAPAPKAAATPKASPAPAKKPEAPEPAARSGGGSDGTAVSVTATAATKTLGAMMGALNSKLMATAAKDPEMAAAIKDIDDILDAKAMVENPQGFLAQKAADGMIDKAFSKVRGMLDAQERGFRETYPPVSRFRSYPVGGGWTLDKLDQRYERAAANLRLPASRKTFLMVLLALSINDKTTEQEIERNKTAITAALARQPGIAAYMKEFDEAGKDYSGQMALTWMLLDGLRQDFSDRQGGLVQMIERRGEALYEASAILDDYYVKSLPLAAFPGGDVAPMMFMKLRDQFAGLAAEMHRFAGVVKWRPIEYDREMERLDRRTREVRSRSAFNVLFLAPKP